VKRRAKSYHYEQLPALDLKTTGMPILGNFSVSIIPPDLLDLDAYPVTGISFDDHSSLSVSDVLTKIYRWSSYTTEYLVKVVNTSLGEYLVLQRKIE
jgi:hypothetical protein